VADMQNLDLVGGHVALDFANTGSLDAQPPSERLVAYRDLVTFAVRTDLIGEGRAADLVASAEQEPDRAGAVLSRARHLRDVLDRVFTAVAITGRAQEADIAELNGFLTEGMRYRRLEPDERCCGWTWSAGDEPLAQMLWPIANAAAELLVGGELDRVKRCGNDTCAWLFVDVSRNRSRRWCDMKECGNRAKARRHYARKKDAPSSGS
jgi:predicted RNA-binding Zn ribbon-like protein